MGVSSGLVDLELHWALGLVLHDDGTCCHPIAMAHVPDFEGYEVTPAQLAVDAQVELSARVSLGERGVLAPGG